MAGRVRHVRLPSQGALGEVEGELDLLYVDGAHRYGPARDDLRDWGARVRPGGALLVHDCFSSVGVTLALVRELVFGTTFDYEGRAAPLPAIGVAHCVVSHGPRTSVGNCYSSAGSDATCWSSSHWYSSCARSLARSGSEDLTWPY